MAFKESFVPIPGKTVHPLRCITALIEAAQNRAVRFLAIIFFCMQLGNIIFFQLIQLHLKRAFHYSTFLLGVYNGALGAGFIIGALVLFRLFLKFLSIRQLVILSFFITGLLIISLGFFHHLVETWILSISYTLFYIMAYSGFYSILSDAVDSNKQGWVMGIAISTMSLTFALGGFVLDLVPYLGVLNIIMIGGGIYLLSGFLMIYYVKRIYVKPT
jgi:predicted MFS family arabinose efflux permease